jgi:hypothetical protein
VNTAGEFRPAVQYHHRSNAKSQDEQSDVSILRKPSQYHAKSHKGRLRGGKPNPGVPGAIVANGPTPRNRSCFQNSGEIGVDGNEKYCSVSSLAPSQDQVLGELSAMRWAQKEGAIFSAPA